MKGEAILGGLFVFYTAFVLIIFGIRQYRSEKPVIFWAGKEPPKREEVTDVKTYNHRHGIMWILYGAGLIVSFVLSFIFDEKLAGIVLIVIVVGGIILMVLYHNRLERLYVKKIAKNNDSEMQH